VKASPEHSRFAASERRDERPVLRALPSLKDGTYEAGTARAKEVREVTAPSPTHQKFDARAFVFACLQDNPDLKLAELEQLARACNQELSQPTASRYRKQFFAHRESSSVVNTESSTMNMQGAHES